MRATLIALTIAAFTLPTIAHADALALHKEGTVTAQALGENPTTEATLATTPATAKRAALHGAK